MRDENAVLKDQLAQKDSQTQRLTRQYNRLSGNLGNGQEKTRAQEAKIKKQATEIGNLKVRGVLLESRDPLLTIANSRLKSTLSVVRSKTQPNCCRKNLLFQGSWIAFGQS